MKKIISIQHAKYVTKQIKAKNLSIVLVGGCFDIIHLGHIQFLKKAKEHGDKLIVMLESDWTLKKLKGKNRPLNNQKTRAQILSHLPTVDYITLLPSHLVDLDYFRLVKIIKPDIIAITSGDPIKNIKERQAIEVGGKVQEVISRIEKYSTTRIIENAVLPQNR